MYKSKKILALIPARGGSKGLPGKNIKSLAGSPLISYSITEAKKSKYIDNVFVSTDSDEIAQVAKVYGAEIPFLRPAHLAQDSSKGVDVVLHTIEWLKNSQYDKFDYILLLQPTSPLRIVDDIDKIIEEIVNSEIAKCLVSVSLCEHHPLWSNQLPVDSCLENFIPSEIKNKNRQDLPSYYRFNGSLYISELNYLQEQKSFIGPNSFAFILPQERSLDIDSSLDFEVAEKLLSQIPSNQIKLKSFLKYHQYLLKRSYLGAIYRSQLLYPRIKKYIIGNGLDIGCGIGDFLSFYPDSVGVDINPYNVNYCKNIGLYAELYDGLRLNYKDKSFDFVVLDNVLEHIDNPRKLLNEISRVLKQNGLFLIGLPGKKGFKSDDDHKLNYTEIELSNLLKNYSFVLNNKFHTPLPFESSGNFLRQQSTYYIYKLQTTL